MEPEVLCNMTYGVTAHWKYGNVIRMSDKKYKEKFDGKTASKTIEMKVDINRCLSFLSYISFLLQSV
jgi:hypothetical protein